MTSHQIFVFGTLKEGFPNFSENDGTRIAGQFLTKPHYELYLVGPRCTPWMIPDQGNGIPIAGEVYSVDDAGLVRMDRLERITEADGYQRELINVADAESQQLLSVYVYLKRAEQLDRNEIQAGPLSEYSKEHAARYQPRTK